MNLVYTVKNIISKVKHSGFLSYSEKLVKNDSFAKGERERESKKQVA